MPQLIGGQLPAADKSTVKIADYRQPGVGIDIDDRRIAPVRTIDLFGCRVVQMVLDRLAEFRKVRFVWVPRNTEVASMLEFFLRATNGATNGDRSSFANVNPTSRLTQEEINWTCPRLSAVCLSNALALRIRLDLNPAGLRGLEKTGRWAGIPHFKVGNVHIPVERGFAR